MKYQLGSPPHTQLMVKKDADGRGTVPVAISLTSLVHSPTFTKWKKERGFEIHLPVPSIPERDRE